MNGWTKWIALIGSLATVAAGSGYVGKEQGFGAGKEHGIAVQDAIQREAFERCKCKLKTTMAAAKESGWMHPGGDWCHMDER